jgi:hypothetical protein
VGVYEGGVAPLCALAVGIMALYLFTESQEDDSFLTHNPEEIVDQTLAHPGRLLHMVLENYLKVFRDMNDTCRAIHYASDTDTMMSEFRVSTV